MHIGVVRISLALPSRTLKEKRTIVRSVVERLRNRFNAAVAEIDALDTPARAVIAASVISNDPSHAQAQLHEIADSISNWRLDAEVTDIETETIPL
ncbi:MAG: DUF503 domain-containing protein [Dehalococcoidia bacterium]